MIEVIKQALFESVAEMLSRFMGFPVTSQDLAEIGNHLYVGVAEDGPPPPPEARWSMVWLVQLDGQAVGIVRQWVAPGPAGQPRLHTQAGIKPLYIANK